MEKYPSQINLNELRRRTAEAKRIIIVSKKESWKNYVSSLSTDTPVSELWKKVKSFKGQAEPQNYPLIHNNMLVDGEKKAEILCNKFKETTEIKSVKVPGDLDEVLIEAMSNRNDADYNQPFCMGELKNMTDTLKQSSCGGDNLHNIFL